MKCPAGEIIARPNPSRLALHCRRIRILDLSQSREATRYVARAEKLGHDALEAERASVPEYDFAFLWFSRLLAVWMTEPKHAAPAARG
jgi:hypothetical protein